MLLYDSVFVNSRPFVAPFGYLNSHGKQCAGQSVGAMEQGNEGITPPCERSPKGQVKRPNRPEHVRAFEFLKFHYEEDPKADIPIQKSDVYKDYQAYCTQHSLKPLVAADFGRILKSVFPNAKDRRLGSRGCSKYCYVGVKRKAATGTDDANAALFTPEDVCKACEELICEWASTVLSRKIWSSHELAKYLLKNRFVQTRSRAALTLTASLTDAEELNEIHQPVNNKHRETQLKLQEKLREKLLNKQTKVERTGSLDDSELCSMSIVDGTHTHMHSASSSPDSDAQGRLTVHSSAPPSSRTSPDLANHSVNSSACPSPVFNETVQQKALFPINYQRNGLDTMSTAPPIPSQCDSLVSSERTTPITAHYTQFQGQQYQYDPRIQSCPTTPLPSYQQSFDFSRQTANAPPSQCMSLPGSARNTPVAPDYQDANGLAYHATPPAIQSSGDLYQQQFSDIHLSQFNGKSLQKTDFGRNNNSAFVPIKDGVNTASTHLDMRQPPFTPKPVDLVDSSAMHNDSDELEISEILLEMLDNGAGPSHSQGLMQDGSQPTANVSMEERVRSVSAQGQAVHGTCNRPPHLASMQSSQASANNSVIYNLLKSGPNHSAADSGRYRHHSGPPMSYANNCKSRNLAAAAASHRHLSSGSARDINSPPSTPNGNFRPVLTPSREMSRFYGGEQTNGYSVRSASSSPAGIPNRVNSSLVGTMSPPAQPLKRKRNISGERIQSGLTSKPYAATKPAPPNLVLQDSQEFMAKRSLGNQLSSPVVFSDGANSQANSS